MQDLVQIVANDFKTELREKNHWLLFEPIPVEHLYFSRAPRSHFRSEVNLVDGLELVELGLFDSTVVAAGRCCSAE